MKCLHGFTREDRFLVYRIMFDEYVERRLGFIEFDKHELYLFLNNKALKNMIVFHVKGGIIDFRSPVIVGADIRSYK